MHLGGMSAWGEMRPRPRPLSERRNGDYANDCTYAAFRAWSARDAKTHGPVTISCNTRSSNLQLKQHDTAVAALDDAVLDALMKPLPKFMRDTESCRADLRKFARAAMAAATPSQGTKGKQT